MLELVSTLLMGLTICVFTFSLWVCAASSLQETMAEQEQMRVALLSALQVGTSKKVKLIEPIVTFQSPAMWSQCRTSAVLTRASPQRA